MTIHGLFHENNEDADHDNSHEHKGHGVSEKWIQKRVTAGTKKVSTKRLQRFSDKMNHTVRYAKRDNVGLNASAAHVIADNALHSRRKKK